MKITTEKYNVLKLIADDIAVARACPKELERYHKIVIDDDGKDRVVKKFSSDMTRAAILLALVAAVEEGSDYTKVFLETGNDKKKKPAAIEDESQEHDVFTKEALEKIPPGKPDSSTLNPPRAKMKVKGKHTHPEGHYWIDDNGRHWRIVDGKKMQQKKPKVQ